MNEKAENSVALFRDCDRSPYPTIDPPFLPGCLSSGGLIFKKKLNPLFSETYSVIASNGQQTGSWDNIHQTYRSWITERLNPVTAANRHVAGGCPECVHSHWRWGTQFGESFNNGKLYFPAGSDQDFAIGIVRYHAGEEHPPNFLDLISFTNPEPIRSRLTGVYLPETDNFRYTIPEEVVYWASATGHKSTDEFFSHYSFFNTDEPNVVRPIQKDSLPLSGKSSTEEASLTGVDAPASITYGHLQEDGATAYSERDPATIAPLPNGYVNYNNVSYDIRTTASVSGPHTVTFNLPSVTDQTTFNSLRVLHSEADPFNSANSIWVDRTILSPNTPAPDFANRNLSAKVYEVGPFVIVRRTSSPPPNTNVADLSIAISESADPAVAGSDLIYTVNVTNSGANMATGTLFSNGLSPDVSFVSADAGAARFCQEENGTVVCDLSSIAPGVTIPVVITVKPNEGTTRFPPEGKPIFNTAFVTANESDPNENNNTAIESTTVLPNPNAPPTVKVLSPSDALLAGPATFNVIVDAADSDGAISQVELFEDGVSVGNETFIETNKYSVNRSGVAYGQHLYTAVATDNGGRKAVSNSITVYVNGPAKVDLTSPTENALFGRPANITLTATAGYSAGSISQVEFFANGTSIGTGALSGANQYNKVWSNMPNGTYSIRAVATDNNNLKTYSATAIIYITNAPVVAVTNSTPNAAYPKNTNINFTANARDFDGYIAKVEFFYDGSSLGTGILTQADSFSRPWSNATVGTHTITAVATDNSGKTSTSNPIGFTITNVSPTVNMTAPANGSTFTAPANITLSANASDGDGSISKVEFFRGTTLISTLFSPPYTFSWNGVVAGNYSLTAKATDNDGAAATSNPVAVTVNAIGDALLVVGNTTLSSVDTAIKTRLQNLGLNVVVKLATAAVSADATGKRVVVISDSVTPTNVNTKFRTVAVPVVTLDPQLFDDMGMCATVTTNFGTTATQKNVTITNTSHPMAAGLSGTIQVTSATTTFAWGIVNANAAKIATLTTDATKATDFGYASGAAMPGLTAPARRVGFFYTASSASLTANGGLLFDNAIKWTIGI